MLQVIILREEKDNTDGSSHINEIRDLNGGQTISTFNEHTGKIDLSCLANEVGKRILVSHYVSKNGQLKTEYGHEKTLKELGTDENGLQYISYE